MAYNTYPAVDGTTYQFPPEIITALAKNPELRSTIIPMTQTQRNDLSGLNLWDGRLVFNLTTSKINRYEVGTTAWYEIDSDNVVLRAGDTMTGPLTLSGPPTVNLHAATKKYVDDYRPYTGRNLARNGAMRISQRGASQPAGLSGYATDGWLIAMNADATMVASQQTASPPPGFRHYARQSMSTADTSLTGDQYSHFYSTMEGSWLAFLEWGTANAKPITISFWIRTSIGGTYTGSVRSAGAGVSYVFTFTTTSNTWEYKTITIPGATTGTWGKDADSWGSLVFCQGFSATCTYRATTANTWLTGNYIGHASQTNMLGTVGATFDITGVQIEEGLLATPFEHKSYAQDLRECHRYYYRHLGTATYTKYGVGLVTTGTQAVILMKLPRSMRIPPTINAGGGAHMLYDGTATPVVSGFALDMATTDTYAATVSASAGGLTVGRACMVMNNNNTAGWIDFTAEL
jgi:hypothetical protein